MKYNVKCNKCGHVHAIEVPLDEVDSYEREMGPEVFYQGSNYQLCECGNKIEILVEGSEYPQGADIEIYNVDVDGGDLVS